MATLTDNENIQQIWKFLVILHLNVKLYFFMRFKIQRLPKIMEKLYKTVILHVAL